MLSASATVYLPEVGLIRTLFLWLACPILALSSPVSRSVSPVVDSKSRPVAIPNPDFFAQFNIMSHCDAVFRPHPSPHSFKILTFFSSDFGAGGGNDETAQACTVALDISVLDGFGYVQLHRVSAGNRRKR